MAPHSLVDIGANLTDKAFRDDLDTVLDRAASAGVERIILTGTSLDRSRDAAEMAAKSPGTLFSTAGVHPHDAKSCDDATIEALTVLIGNPEVVAVGECGLDYNRDFSPRPVQRKWFEAQLELAAELGMPVFIHERDAVDDTVDIIGRWRDKLPAAVIHCFTGHRPDLERYLELDLHIGITGWICDERRGSHLHPLVKTIPHDRLMIETDSPYLVPRTIRPRPKSRRNEPSFLTHVVETIAACTGESQQQIAERTSRTAELFFALPDRA